MVAHARTRRPQRDPRALGVPVVGHALLELAIAPDASRRDYERALAAEGIPLHPPVVLRATFTIHAPAPLPGPYGDRPAWHVGSPDLFDRLALVADLLVRRGYVAYRRDIACLIEAKRWGQIAGVRLYLRTLVGPDDAGHEMPFDGDELRKGGFVFPLPPRDRVGGADLGERPLPFQPRGACPPPRENRKEVARAASDPTHTQV